MGSSSSKSSVSSEDLVDSSEDLTIFSRSSLRISRSCSAIRRLICPCSAVSLGASPYSRLSSVISLSRRSTASTISGELFGSIVGSSSLSRVLRYPPLAKSSKYLIASRRRLSAARLRLTLARSPRAIASLVWLRIVSAADTSGSRASAAWLRSR